MASYIVQKLLTARPVRAASTRRGPQARVGIWWLVWRVGCSIRGFETQGETRGRVTHYDSASPMMVPGRRMAGTGGKA